VHSKSVGLSPALAFAVVACAAAGLPAGISLSHAARPWTGPYRWAYLLLGTGVLLATGCLVLPLVTIAGAPHASHLPHTWRLLGATVAAGGVLAAAALVAGLLLLPGVASCARVRARRLLDGTMVSVSAFFVGWIVLVVPDRSLEVTATRASTVATVPLGASLAVAGIVAMTALRAPRPRRGVVLTALGAALVAAGAGTVAGALCYAQPGFVLAGGITVSLGILGMAFGVPSAHRAAVRPDSSETMRTGLTVPVVAVASIGVASLYSLSVHGPLDTVSVVVGLVDGVALLARQSLAVHDARRANAELAQSEAHYRDLAHTDPLTGLANRRELLRVLHERALGGASCVLLALDLDGFKNINDMRGHDVGDSVLVEVGRRLRTQLRAGDLAARLGGDEFAVLMWARPAEARQVARRLLEALSRPYVQDKGTVFLSASIGLAGCQTANSVASLLRNADLALRHAKQRGKARVELYDAGYDAMLRRHGTIEYELRGAIERDELHLAFQPVVSLPSIRPVGAEALLRWQHPVLGPVAPAEFIPVAEEAGLVGRLDLWVLHQACHQLSHWLAEGHDVWVSVNVSVRELHAPDYLSQVAEVLRAHRVPAQRLVLEVTEHAVATDVEQLVGRLGELRDTGVRVALDDFGAGYSSLLQLHRLPVDILKIDRGLLVEPAPGPSVSAAPLVDVVVRLGQRLGLSVIAEGVEEVAQRRLLEEAGCPYAQGLLFGRAMPAEHVEALLAAAAPRIPASGSTVDPLISSEDRSRPAHHMGPVDSGREMRQA
jgi:diguanylate cyclase (GGDEF)-like protein